MNVEKQLHNLTRGEHHLYARYLTATGEHIVERIDGASWHKALSVHRCHPDTPYGCRS